LDSGTAANHDLLRQPPRLNTAFHTQAEATQTCMLHGGMQQKTSFFQAFIFGADPELMPNPLALA
jgi:hypothetical protein